VNFFTAKDECDIVLKLEKSSIGSKRKCATFWRVCMVVSSKKSNEKLGGQVCKNFRFLKGFKQSICNSYNYKTRIIRLSGDVHLNPGPTNKKLLIGTYNVRGASDRGKTKRLLNYAAQRSKFDRFIYSFQETHITEKRRLEIEYSWRNDFVLSPGQSNSRGVLTLFNNNLFERILYKYGDPNGRATWLAGTYNGTNELFVSIYAPNNGVNKDYYVALFKEVQRINLLYNIDNTYVLGDFNINLDKSTGTRNSRRITEAAKKEIKRLKLEIASDKYNPLINVPTWQHGNKVSTIDYVLLSKHLSKMVEKASIIWGVDKSDHAAIEVVLDLNICKGPGMFRPDTAFLEVPELVDTFRNDLLTMFEQMPSNWDPHMKLEFVKLSARTLLGVASKKHVNKLNADLNLTRQEMNKIMVLKNSLLCGNASGSKFDLKDVNTDLEKIKLQLDGLLSQRSKYLATRARTRWLELGEKSNKYFLNIIHRNSYKSYIKELYDPDNQIFVSEDEDKLSVVYKFYSELYAGNAVKPSDAYLKSFSAPTINHEESGIIDRAICNSELVAVLKKCGNTASGPDGIGYNVLKIIWDIYNPYLIESWNYGLRTGELAPSHREAVICLLEKKGKDRRYVNNLRPISLSNCDIKIISKAITARFKTILPRIIHPMQAAYIAGRQVHDNLRLINIVKEYRHQIEGKPVLIGLDAKKAFDSVSHSFIEDTLIKYGFSCEFRHLFKTMYNNVNSRVLINGFLSKPFRLERSVKQGDSLSCVLFDLCIDT
jgi:exonuclease III